MINKGKIILALVLELKMRGFNTHLRFKDKTVESRNTSDKMLCELIENNVIQTIYVETPHGKESIQTLRFAYCFDINSLVITYGNGRVKVINLYQ